MQEDLRVLILEDDADDAELIYSELESAGYTFSNRVVSNEQEFIQSLKTFSPDVILSDYRLPDYSRESALAHARDLCPDVPFILVAGAAGENRAPEAPTDEAGQHVPKKRLGELASAVNRALSKAARKRSRVTGDAGIRSNYALRDNLLRPAAKAKETEEHLRTLIMASSESIFHLSPDGKTLLEYSNGGFLADTCVPDSGWIGEIIDPQECPRILDLLQRAISEKSYVEWETRVRRRDGGSGWAFWRMMPLNNDKSEIVGWLGTVKDISAQKRYEYALRESETRLRAALDAGQLGAWLHDCRTNQITLDERCSEHLNLPRQTTTREWARMIHADDLDLLTEKITDCSSSGKEYVKEEYRVVCPDGSIKWIEAHTHLHFDEVDNCRQLVYASGITQDITVRKRTEREKERLISDLKTINSELESFSYSVSHDLRAPLRAIEGFSSRLLKSLDDKLSEDERRRFKVIRDSVKKMNRLIDELLALSRVGLTKITYSKIDMNKLAKAVWDQHLSLDPEIRVVVEIGKLPAAVGDANLIQQVFYNLISNAVKYTGKRERGMIEIGGLETTLETIFYVKDNGIGFDMEYYDKIFGVFQRLHDDSEYEGMGIGLAIVQRIINRHRGRIWADGKVDEGAVFYFSLPKSENMKTTAITAANQAG